MTALWAVGCGSGFGAATPSHERLLGLKGADDGAPAVATSGHLLRCRRLAHPHRCAGAALLRQRGLHEAAEQRMAVAGR